MGDEGEKLYARIYNGLWSLQTMSPTDKKLFRMVFIQEVDAAVKGQRCRAQRGPMSQGVMHQQVTCSKCLLYANAQPYLMNYCASVGIEFGQSAGQMYRNFLAAYHKMKHKDYL